MHGETCSERAMMKMNTRDFMVSSLERYKIKTPFERKVTERGFLGIVY